MSGVLASAVEAISRPFISLFEKSGTGMEPELSELSKEEAGQTPDRQHLFRLFVGWVPKLFTEQDLLPLFQKYGDVRDIIILKDKVSSQPRGCAFVSYATKEEAEAAIHALDKGVHLPGALCPWRCALLAATKEELKALFSQFGEVEEINLFRERRSFFSKGCGFITMATREQAMAAMQALDEKHLLGGSVTPLAVKWADPELQIKKRRAVEDSNTDNRMLFFAKVLRSAGEEAVKALFAVCDKITLFFAMVLRSAGEKALFAIFDKTKRHTADPAAFAASAAAAAAAAAALSPQLFFAKVLRSAGEEELFFAKVLRSAGEEEVKALFARYGRVVEVNLFRAFQGAPTTKGCGLVTMGSNDEAAAAIDALDSKHIWDGMEAPMVVKWMDAALQKRRREEHLAAMRQGLVPSMSMSTDMWSGSSSRAGTSGGAAAAASRSGASLSQGKLLEAAAAAAAAKSGSDSAHAAAAAGSSGGVGLPAELPPVGCAPDAYKLFIGNIPKSYTEEELRPVFQAVGPVVELVVVRDKFTHESKGSAFVWYATRADADQAVLQLNLCRVLQDPSGEQVRPLVVRRANMRKPVAPPTHTLRVQTFESSVFALSIEIKPQQQQQQQRHQSLSGVLDFVGLQQQQQQQGMADLPLQLQPMGMQVQPDYRSFYGTPAAPYQVAGPGSAMDSSSSNILLSAAAPGQFSPAAALQQQQQPQQQQQYFIQQQQQQQPALRAASAGGVVRGTASSPGGAAAAAAAAAAAGIGPVVQMSMQLTAMQMGVLTPQLFNIASMSGADISTVPVNGGVYYVSLTGAQSHVESARQLVGSVLAQLQMTGIM
ncbi:hypothetical protein OEZ86_007184 [Tetradesmus obliquus]|nr:hypothetical protein OEZ86_007184 [Tetradesmus obliquus]